MMQISRLIAPLLLVPALLCAATIPRQAGELTIRMPFGQKNLSEYKGKVVVLALILTSCPHCQETTKQLNVIQRDYAMRGVQVLEGAFNQDAPQKLAEFISNFKPAFPMGAVNPMTVQAFCQIRPTDRVSAPILMFIDRNMQIRAQYYGSDPLFEGDQNSKIRAEIDKLVAESAAGNPAPAAKKAAPKK